MEKVSFFSFEWKIEKVMHGDSGVDEKVDLRWAEWSDDEDETHKAI